MSSFEINRTVPLGSITVFRTVARIERALGAVRSWQNARKTSSALNALTDQQLSDIGLARGDIRVMSERLQRS